MTHPHLEFLQGWFARAWEGRDASAIDDLIEPQAKLYPAAGAEPMSPAEFKAFHQAVLRSYVEVKAKLSQPLCEGEWISVHVELTLVPREGEPLPLFGLLRAQIRAGRIVTAMDSWDWPRFLETRGVLAPDAVASALLGAAPA